MSFKKTTIKKIEKIDKEISLLYKGIPFLFSKIADISGEFEEIQKANKKLVSELGKLVSELGKRDRALLEFLKVKIEEVKTVKTDENGKDVIVYSYKLTRK